ncbi:MAG: T9SS type A sorting domain-containing protein [Owenweeksia sp.]|nr:T9SS type A sorting domain-containing protein [Owenweeksia sp.]
MILRSLIFPLLILAIAPGIHCQPSFTEHVIDSSSSTLGVVKMVTADFNNDSFEDVATANIGHDEVAIYLKNATGNYGTRQVVSNQVDYPAGLAAGDINGDNWTDLVTFSLIDEKLAWFPNQNGSFSNKQIIDSGYFAPVSVFARDFENNGTIDIVAIDDTSVSYYNNDGTGNFTFSELAGQTEFYSGGIADVNGDGFLDVMLGSSKLYTYINNGDGTFSRDTINEPLINNLIFEIELADIDGDADQDMALYFGNIIPYINWYENDGTGKFSLADTITNNSNDVKSMRLADLNKDGAAEFVTAYGQTGELVWMENDGQGNFSSESVIKTYPILLRRVAVADVDHDGDMDLFCGHNSKGLYFWENLMATTRLSEGEQDVKLYPNPTSEVFFLHNTEPGHITAFNMQGLKLFEKSLSAGANELHAHLPSGCYLLKWTDGKEVFSGN